MRQEWACLQEIFDRNGHMTPAHTKVGVTVSLFESCLLAEPSILAQLIDCLTTPNPAAPKKVFNFLNLNMWDRMQLSLLCRPSFGSSRVPPPRMSAEKNGNFRS